MLREAGTFPYSRKQRVVDQSCQLRCEGVRSITGATYLECDLIGHCEAVARVPADVFLPYHYGRHDDWSALDTERARLAVVS